MIIKNYIYIASALVSKKLGRGKYFRKKLFSTRRILEKNFSINSNFSFLQVGANDGKSFDSLYGFVIKRDVSGIVIEPIKEYFDELCVNYKNHDKILKINKAVHENKKSVSIFKVDTSKFDLYPDWVKGIASFNIDHLTKFDFIKREHIIEEQVIAEDLMGIVNENNIMSFDYFQIDTEGYDYHVINMFDFSMFKPKMVKAEYINLTIEEKKKIKKVLETNGYYVFFQGMDIIGVDLKRIKL
tara:strand:+ start:226 stop:951 length:726 start_codon:yes stop_codon:yes gene_type:complete